MRGQILAVARERFRREGYESVTMRSLAAEAGVDAALISYYFGSKSGLFAAVLEFAISPADELAVLLRGDLETLPARAIRRLAAAYDDPEIGAPLMLGIRAAIADPELGTLLRAGIHHQLVERLTDRLGGADARYRAGLFTSQMVGLIVSRYLLSAEPLASMPVDEIVRLLAPSLRTTLLGPLPAGARPGGGGGRASDVQGSGVRGGDVRGGAAGGGGVGGGARRPGGGGGQASSRAWEP